MTIAITGIDGFLGSRLFTRLINQGHRLVHFARESRQSVQSARIFLNTHQPRVLIHLSGIANVSYCAIHPEEAYHAHVSETLYILEALKKYPCPFVYVASDKSFGSQENCGLATPYQATFPYETSKACEDMVVESYGGYLLRFPNFFGRGDVHEERLIPGIIKNLQENKPFTVRTSLEISRRQYIFIEDAAEIVVTSLNRILGENGVWKKNHFGPPINKTVGEVIKDVETVTGKKLVVNVLGQKGEATKLSINDDNYLKPVYTDWFTALEKTL